MTIFKNFIKLCLNICNTNIFRLVYKGGLYMIKGFIYSRSNDSVYEIIKGSPPEDVKKFNNKLYSLLKPYIFDLKDN